jgi:hypothetical protein
MIYALLVFAVITLVPGYAVLSALRADFSHFERLVLGAVVGLALLAVGGAIAATTQLDFTRWLPSLFALFAWMRFRRVEKRSSNWFDRLKLPLIGLLGVAAILPNILKILRNQPLTWNGTWSFYGDVPFQIAMVSATGMRPAWDYPWALETPIQYTWLFHSALGAWAQLANLTGTEMILHAWPIAYGLLLPLTAAVLCYRVTRNYLTTILLMVALPFVRVGATLFTSKINGLQFPISPTFEFGVLLTAAIVTLVISQLPQLFQKFSLKTHGYFLVVIGLAVFANTGSKGSTWFVSLGAIGVAWLVVWQRVRSFKTLLGTTATWLAGVSLLSGLAANLLIVKTTAGTHLDPAHLFRGSASEVLLNAASIGIVLAAIAFALVSGQKLGVANALASERLPGTLVAGSAFAGLISMVLLSHPDDSQNYFWYSAFIFWLILCVDIFSQALAKYRLVAISIVLLVKLGISIATYQATHGKFFLALCTAALLCALQILGFAVVSLLRDRKQKTAFNLSILRWISLAIVALIAFIPVQQGLRSWSYQDREGIRNHEAAVSSDALSAMQFVEKHSKVTDGLATNQYCPEHEAGDSRCATNPAKANPWFTLSAFSGRDVLFESNGYSWQVADTVAAGNLVKGQLSSANFRLSQAFMNNPSSALTSRLKAKGVRLLFINTLFSHAKTYSPFAHLVYQKGVYQVWRLSA